MFKKKEKIQVGLIGAGNFVQSNHIPYLLSNDKINIPWVYDSNTDQINRVKSMYGLIGIKEDQLEYALRNVNIVLLTVPYGVRKNYYNLLSQNQIAIYVEKPFARSLVEHDELAKLCSKLPLTIGFNRRFYKNHQSIKAIVLGKIFGELKDVVIRQGFFSVSGGSGFRAKAELSGGGVLIESGIHLIDAVLYITNPISTFINKKNVQSDLGIDYHTEAFGDLHLNSGVIPFSIEISTLQNFKSGIWFEFESATVYCPMDPAMPITFEGKHEYTKGVLDLGIEGAQSVAQSLSMIWGDCINSCTTGVSPSVSPKSARLTTGLLEQIYAGIES